MTTPPIGLGPSTSEYTETPVVTPWPAPEIASHEVPADYLGKSAVIRMATLAESKGWTVQVTHAKGSFPSVGGRPGPARDSLAVRMWRREDRAVAVYVQCSKTWDWKLLRRWTLNAFPTSFRLLENFERML